MNTSLQTNAAIHYPGIILSKIHSDTEQIGSDMNLNDVDQFK